MVVMSRAALVGCDEQSPGFHLYLVVIVVLFSVVNSLLLSASSLLFNLRKICGGWFEKTK
jgi:hypothetical protein